jgi:hypothetical protein
VAAIIAHAASTALPPRSNIIAPAVAASGLPVIAIHLRPCRGGFCVLAIERAMAGSTACAAGSLDTLIADRPVRTQRQAEGARCATRRGVGSLGIVVPVQA